MTTGAYSLKLGPLQKSVVEVEVLGSVFADPDADPKDLAMANIILDHFTRTGQLLVVPAYRSRLLEILDIESGDPKVDKAALGLVLKMIERARIDRPG
jgi:hypothetical protein